MRLKNGLNLSLGLSIFLGTVFLTTSTWALPNVTPASSDNLKIYMEQIIGQQGHRNYKNIEVFFIEVKILRLIPITVFQFPNA